VDKVKAVVYLNNFIWIGQYSNPITSDHNCIEFAWSQHKARNNNTMIHTLIYLFIYLELSIKTQYEIVLFSCIIKLHQLSQQLCYHQLRGQGFRRIGKNNAFVNIRSELCETLFIKVMIYKMHYISVFNQ